MKYARDPEPFKTQTEALSYLYLQLGSAYSIIAQYERDERKRDHEGILEMLSKAKEKKD